MNAYGENFVAVIGANGWNDSYMVVIHAKVGQELKITIINNDPHHEDHPLSVADPPFVKGPQWNPFSTIQFTPTAAGTYLVLCENPMCIIHTLIDGRLLIVVS